MRIQIKDNKYYFLLALRTALLYSVYLFFFLYTPKAISAGTKYLKENFSETDKYMILGETALKIEVADSNSERTKGLSGRKSLDKNSGLFFIFDEEDVHGIWMKDMNFPIDIMWFNKYSELIAIEENVSPDTYPKVFSPKVKSSYVLETNAGFVKSNSIMLGDTIDLR